MSMENEEVMQSALAGIVPFAMAADDTMSDAVPAEPQIASVDPEIEAEIDRRITSRLRAGEYAQRRRQRDSRYGSLRSALLEAPDVTASSGELIQMIFSPLNIAQPQQPMMIEQQPAQEQMPRSALADLAESIAGEVASPR